MPSLSHVTSFLVTVFFLTGSFLFCLIILCLSIPFLSVSLLRSWHTSLSLVICFLDIFLFSTRTDRMAWNLRPLQTVLATQCRNSYGFRDLYGYSEASTNAIAHLPRNLHGSASSTGTMARMPWKFRRDLHKQDRTDTFGFQVDSAICRHDCTAERIARTA